MDLFITSKIGAADNLNGRRTAGKIDDRFGFLTNFKKCLHKTGQMLYISSDPKPNERVSEWFQNTVEALKKEGIRFDKCTLVNGHNVSRDRKRLL